ncbi:MAG: DMT family transporter [Planctomycetota bacterium]
MPFRTALSTVLALLAFAGNSLLCREALRSGSIDAASFTAIRIASGAAALCLLAARRGPRRASSTTSALALVGYAVPFSFAYLRLSAGTGALILFAAVQAVMIGAGLARGERPSAVGWFGIALAFGGLVWLALPGATAPDPAGGALMAAAGAAWGVYSLRGRARGPGTGVDPLAATAGNFARAVPLVVAILCAAWLAGSVTVEPRGALLAATSGALTSGVGYAIWYAALRGLTATRAAVVQLLVPVIAALGGVALLGEAFSSRLAVAGVAILVGVLLAERRRAQPKRRRPTMRVVATPSTP